MASKQFIQAQLKKLESNYGKERFKVTQPMFDLWSDMFKDYNEEGLEVSVNEYILTNEYPPSVASIAKIYKVKDEYRRNLLSYLKNRYIWVCRWIEEKPTHDTFVLFRDYALKFPQQEREMRVERLIDKVIDYYNDKQGKKPFKDWLSL